MVRENKRFVALLCEHKNRPILRFQEGLCAHIYDGQLGEVMSLAIRVINFNVARASNDRQLKTLMDEVGSNYHGLILHSNARWLSKGEMLSRFAACLNEIRTSLEVKGIEYRMLAETEWLLMFYYLVDMTEHLNQITLNCKAMEMQCYLFNNPCVL
ncbi:unnamed protein product [Dibothriocephalus latus]|uniref:Uncharacterized protein n=1 Tax=Dibothriocephalus latus TaxID=60516 RepID=A0A3P6SQJ6_DIBLA|nr:unnamed protein product [Dibothriocephalus latus]